MPVASIILAAGAAARMGSPKALLSFGGKTFLKKLISDYRQIGCNSIVVVLGLKAEQTRLRAEKAGARIAVNSHPENGPLSSLKIGLSLLSENCTGFFFHPVDHPAVQVATLNSMLELWKKNRGKAIKPIYQDRGGHPVLMGSAWIDRILQTPPRSNMRELLYEHRAEVIEFPVLDSGILMNIDTPSDYKQLLELNSHR